MTRHLTALALAALLPAAALAQDPAAPGTIPGEHLDAVDGDGDGRVTLEELTGVMAAAFSALDADGDGFVSWPEAEVTMTRAQFDGADANGDQGLTEAELTAQVERDFAAADLDGNGVLD